MSAIAQFTKLPESCLPELQSNFDGTIETHGESVADYDWSGYVLATLLPFLAEKKIDLMKGGYDEFAMALSQKRGATIFIFSSAQRDAYLERLLPEYYTVDSLRDYFNSFNETDEPEIGEAMMDGIVAIRESLASLDTRSVILLSIG